MSTRRKIGVAVIGLGIGEQHARAYHKMDNCIIHWFYDLSHMKARVIADKLGQGRVAASFEEILHDPKVQIVSVASYDSAHFEQVVAALDAGKHVFVEKPICRTLDELEIIKQAWIQYRDKLKLSSNLVLRSAPLYQWLKKRIESGDFGEIYAFDGSFNPSPTGGDCTQVGFWDDEDKQCILTADIATSGNTAGIKIGQSIG